MSDDELEAEVLRRVGMGRREFVRKLVLGSAAFAVPAIASFDMASFSAAPAQPMTGHGTKRPTTLVALPAIVSVGPPVMVQDYTLTATLTLTNTGAPLVGKKITFSAGGQRIGSATTDANGTARLNLLHDPVALGEVARARGYQARFAGSSTLDPASAQAPLVQT